MLAPTPDRERQMQDEASGSEYEKPDIVEYGDLETLTAAATLGTRLDHDFSRGVSISLLTFS